MSARARATWALAVVFCVALLMAPALWNGFPLLQYDTGGYLARWYEGYLVPSRAVVYGLILNAGEWWDFWPVVVAQSALTVWVIALVLRAHDVLRPLWLTAVIAALCLLTTLPWLSAILLTDIFCGLGVLALYLLMLRTRTLNRAERVGLALVIAVGAATHSATIAVLLAMLLSGAAILLVDPERIAPARLRAGLYAVLLGAALVFAANFAVSGRLAWTPGGFALSFGRMLQDGIVNRYLDDHCPDPELRLCAFKNQLPRDADQFFWGNDIFIQLGRFAGLRQEMTSIALGSIVAYPMLQIETAAIATARQLIAVHTGEGVLNSIWHTYGIIARYTPWALPQMRAARQQRGEIGFDAINAFQYPMALLAMALLPLIALPMREPGGVGELAITVTLALIANAVVCGVFSNPHDRYGARLIWVASLTVLVALLRAWRTRHPP